MKYKFISASGAGVIQNDAGQTILKTAEPATIYVNSNNLISIIFSNMQFTCMLADIDTIAGVAPTTIGDAIDKLYAVFPDAPVLPAGAGNPSVLVGLTAVNGSANTFMRSDAAPAINQNINPVWTNIHTFTQNPILKSDVPGLQFKQANDTTLGFLTAIPGVGTNLSTQAGLKLQFNAGTNQDAQLTLGINGEIGLGNPIQNGTAGQVIVSGGTGAPALWKSASVNVASDSKNAQTADINSPTFYAVPVTGIYRVSAFLVLTQAATTSSVLPSCSISYTEAVTGTAVQDKVTQTANTNLVGLHNGGSVVISAQQGSNIGYITSNYASSGATSMQYSIQIKIEFLG
jgi:hypothetical protein